MYSPVREPAVEVGSRVLAHSLSTGLPNEFARASKTRPTDPAQNDCPMAPTWSIPASIHSGRRM
jgi:hypothetical protein